MCLSVINKKTGQFCIYKFLSFIFTVTMFVFNIDQWFLFTLIDKNLSHSFYLIINTFLPRVRVNYKYFFYIGLGLIINTFLPRVRVN